MAIVIHDLNLLIDRLNLLTNLQLSLEHYNTARNPYRLIDENQQIIVRGTKRDIYFYVSGAVQGINTFMAAHNIRHKIDLSDYTGDENQD